MKNHKKILIQKITAASRIAFTKIIKEKPTENFFAFCLLTLDDALCCYAYANSEESHLRTIEGITTINTIEAQQYRWCPEEWEYENLSSDAFDEVYDYSEQQLRLIKDSKFYNYKLDFIDCMERAMKILDAEGVFGEGKKRQSITLFLTVADSFMSEKVEKKSAKNLNSSKVYKKFKNRLLIVK